uniref:Uncharacterized protein n=1 Tax=Medicago truncatula TaxID=3880 RepID=I3SWK9_MEDTR|nr:unknown [Medicago truncatula]
MFQWKSRCVTVLKHCRSFQFKHAVTYGPKIQHIKKCARVQATSFSKCQSLRESIHHTSHYHVDNKFHFCSISNLTQKERFLSKYIKCWKCFIIECLVSGSKYN